MLNKYLYSKNEIDARDKITVRFVHETKHLRKHSRLKRKIFTKIFNEEKQSFKLNDTFDYPYDSLRTRIKRGKLRSNGRDSPLKPIEPKILMLIKCMNNIKRSLTLTDGINLVNDLIKDTPVQKALIEWKMKRKCIPNNEINLGKIGLGYFQNFLSRHWMYLKQKSISEYAIDRSNFTTYLNFADMYNHIERILLLSNVARRLDQAVNMNEAGETVTDEKDGYGFKVPIEIHRPDMCLVLDECGCNLSQENDGRVGKETYLAGVHNKAYSCISTKHVHFTHIGVSLLNGQAMMCVVIVAGKQHDILVELGVDFEKLKDLNMDLGIDDVDTIDDRLLQLIEENTGEGKLFPGIPSCTYKGKEIPGYVAFSESGGITPTILTNIFRRLDNLHIFDEDRSNGIIPFVLLDGHGSRFSIEFLEYINDPEHRWNVCLGVPYGTALWQIADSPQLNGFFKILMTKAKRELFVKRMEACLQDMHLTKTDIIPLVRMCWELSFGNVEATLKAIRERGWGPYNRVLLFNSIIRATMTESMIEEEKMSPLFPHKRMAYLHNIYYQDYGNAKVEIRHIDEEKSDYSKINLDGGATSRYVTSTIVTDDDRQLARERAQKLKEEGKTLKQRLEMIKKFMTSTKMTIEAREYHLNQSIYEYVKNRIEEKDRKLGIQRMKDELDYAIKCYKADRAKSRNPTMDVSQWNSRSDIKSYLDPLKHKIGDEAWPKSRKDMESLYMKLNNRGRHQYVLDETVTRDFEEWVRAEENGEHKQE